MHGQTHIKFKYEYVFRNKTDINFVLIKFNETLQKLTEVFLQVRSDIQEILHLFRPHLHSHEVQVEVSTRNCDLDIGDKRTAVSMINVTACGKFA
jgi:hypothetical protein